MPQTQQREGVNINVWVGDDVGATFLRIVETFRPKATKKGHLEEALRDYCAKLGFEIRADDDQ